VCDIRGVDSTKSRVYHGWTASDSNTLIRGGDNATKYPWSTCKLVSNVAFRPNANYWGEPPHQSLAGFVWSLHTSVVPLAHSTQPHFHRWMCGVGNAYKVKLLVVLLRL
jgi:hypothetical protein